VIRHSRLIPLTSIDWGNGDIRDVTLLELTTPDGITGLGSAYTGAAQVSDALALYQQDPAMLHNSDAEMTIPMSLCS
jgi:L-alanine-DL-glutamate epimerase-like enolase superfamily enzyme